MIDVKNSPDSIALLSALLTGFKSADTSRLDPLVHPATLNIEDLQQLWSLANSHHVVLRSFPALQQMMLSEGNTESAEWAGLAIDNERLRIGRALTFLEPICEGLEQCGNVVVIKSLDHWPDLGSDLDLYTDAAADDVVATMARLFEAKIADRSWGDRLAKKWNFIVPGLPELVEVHVRRLGQTGEQTRVANSLVTRARRIELGGHEFHVPAPEERLIISTLQRMYRHFYIRLCDIVDNASLIESVHIDYQYLRSLAGAAGLWDGLATYLVIISDYIESYRGYAIRLPLLVTSQARFRGDEVHFRRNFLRIPILPHSARLYAAELARLLLNGEIVSTLRLSLLPGLATAAAFELKLTGSDKGIW
jgi:hypothetical protein